MIEIGDGKRIITEQIRLPEIDKYFFAERLAESRRIIQEIATKTTKPLIIQFSGGKDSMVMLSLVKEITDNFICCYMQSGIDFEESVEFARQSAGLFGLDLLISTPADYMGGFFERLERFQRFPTPRSLWCTRDLKVRPQQKILNAKFGGGNFIKLVGVRRSESRRRLKIYKWGVFAREDWYVSGATLIFPILHWTDTDIINYLKLKGLPTSGLYKKYGVSGCYWCPFYGAKIYRRILKDLPNLYDQFIEWEEKLGPSVIGSVYLRDLKMEILQKSFY